MKGAGGYGKIHDYKLSLSPSNVFISPPILYHIHMCTLVEKYHSSFL
jgi:hypothetical protein